MASKAIIGWLNRLDAGTLTAGSADPARPVTNLQTVQPTEKWRTASMSDTYFDVDLGAAVPVQALALVATNLTATATVRIRLSTVSAGAGDVADTGVVSAGVLSAPAGLIEAPANALHILAAAQTARYARVTLADAALSSYIEVGRAFLGPVFAPARNFDLGWSLGWEDSSRVQESEGGQEFVDEGAMRRVLNLSFRRASEAEATGELWALLGGVGLRQDVLAVPRPDSTTLAREWIWGRLRALPLIANRNLDLYEARFEIRERK